MMIFLPFLRTLAQRHKLLALLVCFGSACVVLIALGFEYIGGFMPCKLCLEQRTPYYLVMPIMLVTFLAVGRLPSFFIRILFALTAVLLVYNFGLAVYHAGAEWQFWEGPTDCAASSGLVIENVGNLLDSLNTARPISCSQASFYFLKLSMAGWNGVASFILALIATMGTLMRRPKLA